MKTTGNRVLVSRSGRQLPLIGSSIRIASDSLIGQHRRKLLSYSWFVKA